MTDHGHTRVVTVPLEEYVMGSILAELNLASLDPDAADRILQVQALLARTYAVANLGRHSAEGFDLCTTTHCQLYSRTDGRPPEWVRLARQAVAHTAGQIVLYQGRPIQALFHADCGGQTSAARSVWGGEEPYLSGVTDRHVSPRWRFSVPSDELSRALRRDPRTAVRGRLHRIEILRRDPAGRAVEVSLVGDDARMVRADHLRAVMMRAFGAHSLRSTRFDVHQDGRNQVFEGSGLGHGVGLCQVGALTQAKDGRSPAAIVHFYYPGVEIGRLTPSLWSRAAAAR